LDVSRTVGWFTSLYPVVLDVADAGGRTGDAAWSWQIRQTKETRRRVPRKGVGYGVLRYLTPDGEPDPALACSPEVLFNYLGSFDTADAAAPFVLGTETVGPEVLPRGHRAPPLTVNGVVVDGTLTLTASYPDGHFRREHVAAWLAQYRTYLQQMADHCAGRAPEVTPSDLTVPGLDLTAYETLLELHGVSPSAVADICPLAPLQEGLLFHGLSAPETRAYVEQTGYRLQGALDSACFEAAWQSLLDRHAHLRAAIWTQGVDQPVQAIPRQRRLEYRCEDWRDRPAAEQQAQLAAFREADRARGFDFARDVLLRVAVFRTGEATHEVVWTFHHLLLDGWSVAILTAELEAIYAALAAGDTPALPPATPYRRYLEWLAAQDRAAGRAHWTAALGDYESPATVMPDGRRPASDTGVRRLQSWALGDEETLALETWARAAGVTVGTALQTLWGLLLGRYTGKSDVVFGTTVAGRPAVLPDVERMVGLFINTLPVRVRWADDERVSDVARRVQAAALAREPHAALPLWEIQSASPLGGALFDHVLIVENYPLGHAVPDGQRTTWAVEAVDAVEEMHYALGLVVTREADGLRLHVSHDPAVYPPAQVERIGAHWIRLLAALRQAPDAHPCDLDILPPAERDTLLSRFNDTRHAGAVDRSLVDLFEAQCRRTPDNAAVAYGDVTLTYRELDERAARVASYLRERHRVGRETRVGLLTGRSEWLLVALLGILKAGAAYVPIDPDSPADRARFILEDTGALVLMTVTDGPWPALEGDQPVPRLDVRDACAAGRAGHAGHHPDPDSLAYIIYTSGSTGLPKGVACEHRAAVNVAEEFARRRHLEARDRCALWTNVNFDASIFEIFAPLAVGAAIHVVPADVHASGPAYLDWLSAGRITAAYVPPFLLQDLSDSARAGSACALRSIAVGVEPIDEQLLSNLRGILNGAGVVNGYGPTEATICATLYDVPLGAATRRTPVGRPIPRTQVYLLDRQLAPVPIGVPGEIFIGGIGVARGYVNRPELTAERFVPDPFAEEPGARLYRTGDLARWLPDGNVEFIGRTDRQVKVRGVRVELGEIETRLWAHPGVRDVAVLVYDGRRDRELVAFLVPSAALVSAGELREYLGQWLPIAMIPSRFEWCDAIPMTSSGKVDATRLIARLADAPLRGAGRDAPRTDTERRLGALWGDVLGVEAVGPHDRFLDLGGHSLAAARLVSRARSRHGLAVAVRDLLANASLAEVAAAAGADAPVVVERIPPAPPASRYPLSHAQRRLWLLDQLGDARGNAAYQLSAQFDVRGALDVDRLDRAFRRLFARHEILRTRIVEVDGEPWQEIVDAPAFGIPVYDYGGEPDPLACAAALVREDVSGPFDLSRAPLVRCAVAKLATDRFALLLQLHHIVIDGWSAGILMRELSAWYNAGNDEEVPLEPLPIHYKDYAVWQAQLLASGALDRSRQYWRQVFAEHVRPLDLPRDRPRASRQTFGGDDLPFELDEALTRGLHALARRSEASLFMVLTAAAKALLFRYTAQEDLVVGTPVAVRNHPDLERQIGFYTNTLALRDRVTWQQRFVDLVASVRRTVADGLEHQAYPFDLIVDEVAPV
ncbi:MAG TPA: amino acid adenylation domain-containing protein, partial [Vicinamibacterales bacterium]|nr:amino acid adenylation domain-containing protein [Vicinamibacterales bacterium]